MLTTVARAVPHAVAGEIMSQPKACAPHVPSDDQDKSKARWIISPPVLYLLEQVFKMEHFPSLHMRQRLAADLNVSARQVCTSKTRAPAVWPTNPAACFPVPSPPFICGWRPGGKGWLGRRLR